MIRPGRLESRTIRSAEPGRLADVVRDEQHGELALAPDPLQLVVQDVPGHRVERAERLVHQQHRRCPAPGCGPARPAAACRRTARAAACRPNSPRWTVRSSSATRSPALGPGQPAQLAAAPRRCPRRSATGTAPAPGTSGPGRRRRPVSIVPAAGPVEAGDQVEQRALAAAGRADQADELARADVEARPGRGPGRRSPRPVHLGHAGERDRGGRALRRSSWSPSRLA